MCANATSIETNFHSQNRLHSEGCLDLNLWRTANTREISKGYNATEMAMWKDNGKIYKIIKCQEIKWQKYKKLGQIRTATVLLRSRLVCHGHQPLAPSADNTLLPSPISTVTEIRDNKIDSLSLSLYKPQLEGGIDKNVNGKNSSCFLVKTISESLLCLQLGAEALGVKGVEKCPSSLLTAVEPKLMGVRCLRSALIVRSLICCRRLLWGYSQRFFVQLGLLGC